MDLSIAVVVLVNMYFTTSVRDNKCFLSYSIEKRWNKIGKIHRHKDKHEKLQATALKSFKRHIERQRQIPGMMEHTWSKGQGLKCKVQRRRYQ